jgi:hypothetical protein
MIDITAPFSKQSFGSFTVFIFALSALLLSALCSGQAQPDTFLKEFSNSIGD